MTPLQYHTPTPEQRSRYLWHELKGYIAILILVAAIFAVIVFATILVVWPHQLAAKPEAKQAEHVAYMLSPAFAASVSGMGE